MSKLKSQLELICPRCKEEKEDLDCLYRLVLEVHSVEGSSNADWTAYENTLEDFEYKLCGQCLDKIQEFIRK